MRSKNEECLLIHSDFSLQNTLSNVTSLNSFLVEIDHNDDISKSLRQEINERFSRSKTNKTYKFPRVTQSSSIKLKQSILKFSITRPSKKIVINKLDQSFSPYCSSLNRSRKSKSPNRAETLKSSKTPLPDKSSTRLKYSNYFPKINKVKSDVKRSARFKTLMK